MSATDPPLCRLCQKPHSSREPHILPADAPAEKRSARPNTSADEAKGRKAGNARRDSSADCLSSRFTARAGGTPVKIPDGQPVKPEATKTDPKPARNTSREGRRVLKAEGESPDATRTAGTPRPDPPPATPGKPAGKNRQSRAAKPSPGKRKPRTKIKRKWVKKP